MNNLIPAITLALIVAGFLHYKHVRLTPRIIGRNYLTRYFIIPRNRWFNIYLHKYTGSDDNRALHDHPWWSMSILLKGEIQEYQHLKAYSVHGDKTNFNMLKIIGIWHFIPKFRPAEYTHRIELLSNTAWTLFFTGPAIRQWGFHCRKGWVHWKDFTDETGNGIGAGCGDD